MIYISIQISEDPIVIIQFLEQIECIYAKEQPAGYVVRRH